MSPDVRAPAPVSLPFRIGVRALAAPRRLLLRVPLSLGDVLAGGGEALPSLPAGADGLLVTSLPVARLAAIDHAGRIALVRQRYVRSWADLADGHARWWQGRSAGARSGLSRKLRRLGPAAEMRRFASEDEIAAFLPLARAVARTTYQERLPGAALPDSPAFVAETLARAAADAVRGWLLFVAGVPVAYLFCTAEPRDPATLRYDHVGHDPAYAASSPGTILQLLALRDLMAERRFARLDFLEGDGRHKRLFASGGVDCCDLLLLRRTPANRLLATALASFDAAVAFAGRSAWLRRRTRTLRR